MMRAGDTRGRRSMSSARCSVNADSVSSSANSGVCRRRKAMRNPATASRTRQTHRLHRRLDVGVAREHDHLDVDVRGARPPEYLEPGVVGQMHVHQGDVELRARETVHRRAS